MTHNKLNVWIFKHGEQLPISHDSRIYRMGMIALTCTKKDENVVWWTSSFNHAKKTVLTNDSIKGQPIQYKLLSGITYGKNISIKRIINHHQIGKELTRKMSETSNLPDIIIASMPTLDFAYRAVEFGLKHNIPVIVDVRDLWPDVFLGIIPFKSLRSSKILSYWNKKLKWTLSNATAITTITDNYLEWALNKTNMKYNKKIHKVFPLGYELPKEFSKQSPLDKNYINVIFIGTIGMHFDLDTVLQIAKNTIDKNVRFYIIGDGDKRASIQHKYQLSNVFFTGWLNGEDLKNYLFYADIGIAPYKNTPNFINNIPNKFYEYMAYGLPIITCLQGPSKQLIESNGVGLFYEEGNSNSFYTQLISLVENQTMREVISVKAKILFKEKYSSEVIYREYYEFLKEVIEDNRNGEK